MTLAGPPRVGAFSKPHDYKQSVQKMKGLLKEWALTRNSLKISNQKKPKNPIIIWRTKQKIHKTARAKTEQEPCRQEEINWSKIEKSFQNGTVWTFQD